MIVLIQGLVIMFAGGLEHLFRPLRRASLRGPLRAARLAEA